MSSSTFSVRISAASRERRWPRYKNVIKHLEAMPDAHLGFAEWFLSLVLKTKPSVIERFADQVATASTDAVVNGTYLYQTLSEGDTDYLVMLFPFIRDTFKIDNTELLERIEELLANAQVAVSENPERASEALNNASRYISNLKPSESDLDFDDVFV